MGADAITAGHAGRIGGANRRDQRPGAEQRTVFAAIDRNRKPLLWSRDQSRQSKSRLMLAPTGSLPPGSAGVAQQASPSPLADLSEGSEFARGDDPVDGSAEPLIGIEEVQKALNRSRASVYRYTNTDLRNLNPPFNSRKLNPEYRSDQKEPLLFHPNEVARFARDVLRIKEVTVEVLNSPSTATQQILAAILDELRGIRQRLDHLDGAPADLAAHRQQSQSRPAA